MLPHHLREVTHEQKHEVEIELAETGQVWSLRLCCRQPEVLMTQVSFIFGSDGHYPGRGLRQRTKGRSFGRTAPSGTVREAIGSNWKAAAMSTGR
ncbi:hypothetical protein [Paenibacillus macerans]|uniref:hypothetical protein n=1 Tax=Paenibacillus macerans TaxID=44252 RepID=UPI00203DD291|nr:hypothetical protein [Paenibacillus macerans]MCM3703238.1 hypothetical protein [Paenibacillus macerans]